MTQAAGDTMRNRSTAGRRFATALIIGMLLSAAAGRMVHATPAETGAGTLMLRSGEHATEAPRLSTEIEVSISGMIARVEVRQRFRNPGADFAEGTYLFPLAEQSAVDRLVMRIGEREIVGEIHEREQARKTYAAARTQGRRATLVEQQRPNLFTTAVANIAPQEEIEVRIGYLQVLDYAAGAYSLRLPMTVTSRYDPGEPLLAATDDAQVAAAYHPTAASGNHARLQITLDAGFPLESVTSPYHDIRQVFTGERHLITTREAEIPMDRDFELTWRPALGAEPQAAVFTESFGGEEYALLMLMPPSNEAAVAQPREVVLVIDTSGSMAGASIRQAKEALKLALTRLSPQDRFNVIRFSSGAHSLFRKAKPANAHFIEIASFFVASLGANGGTDVSSALDLALTHDANARAENDGYLRQVVFITDGSVGNEQYLFERIRHEVGTTRLFTVGIGSAPNEHFMRGAARFGRGTFTHIGSPDVVEPRMTGLLERLERPVLSDLRLDLPLAVGETAPRCPDLYAGEPLVIPVRLSADAGNVGVRGKREGATWQRTLALTKKTPSAGVATLWARAHIEALSDSLIEGADPAQVRADIVDLALRHHVVSRYTSLVAVERDPVRAAGMALRSSAVASNRPHGSSGYPAGATPAVLLGWLGLLTLLAAGAASRVTAWQRG